LTPLATRANALSGNRHRIEPTGRVSDTSRSIRAGLDHDIKVRHLVHIGDGRDGEAPS